MHAPPDPAAPNEPSGHARRSIERWRQGQLQLVDDALAEEVPIAMVYNDHSFAVMMATPCDLEDFALGFSLSEGLIGQPDELLAVKVQSLLEGISLHINVAEAAHGAHLDAADQRLLPGRSGCGICGTRELENAVRQSSPVRGGQTFTREALERALTQLQQRQPINALTGAVHAAAWAGAQGDIALVREDVGRHNALDKLIGAMLRAGIDASEGFAVVTSRASYEMVSKAAAAGIPLLLAISAPTALALELARSARMTLVGFARPGSHNVYCDPQRLLETPGENAEPHE